MPDFGMTKEIARKMIDEDRWAELSRHFDFKPTFALYRGKTYFNWVSAPASLMLVLGWTGAPPPHVVKKFKHKVDESKPEAIVLLRATKSPKVPKENSPQPQPRLVSQLFRKQRGCCYYCGLPTDPEKRSKDHKTPRCRGGTNNHRNLVGSCKTCNAAKGSMTVQEFLDTDYLPNTRRAQLGREDLPKLKFADAHNLHGERMKNYILQPLPPHYWTSWPEGYKTNQW